MLIKIIKYIFFFFFLYFFIYNPPFVFLPKSPKTLLSFSFIPLIIKNDFNIYLVKFKELFLILTTVVVYCFIRDFIFGNFDVFLSNLTLYLDLYYLPILMLYFFYKYSIKKDLLEDVVTIGLIACFFTVLAIISTSTGDYFRYELLQSNEFTELVSFRNFGLAEALTFTYSITQGFVFCILLFYSKKYKYLLYLSPLFLVAIMFNARAGFTPVIVGLIIYLLFNFNLKFIMKTLVFSFILLLIVTNISFQEDQMKTIEWGLDFFTQVNDLISGSSVAENNTFDALFGYMLVLPTTELEWIFGTGDFIFARNYGVNSDVGYVLQLYYGGIVFISLLFLIVFWMLKTIQKSKNYDKSAYLLSYVLIITTLIVNVKGNIFSTNGYLRLCILLIMYFYCEQKKKEKTLNNING